MGLAAYIIISASFMLQVRLFLIETFGEQAVQIAFLCLFFLIFALYLVYIIYKRIPLYRAAAGIIIFGLAYLLISKQPFFAEKLHIPEYGLLGYLALRDLSRAGKQNGFIADALCVFCFVALVGSLDEVFQLLLPYRVFELRDILTNVLSGSLGILQCYFTIYRLPPFDLAS